MRGFQHAWRFRAAAGLLALAAGSSARAQSNGIFADFSTSLGNFTVQLDYERAPRAVAGFVGLATGAAGWADPEGNVWTNKPFYAGSIFHRVVKDAGGNGIAIQGGGIQYVSVDTNGVTTTNFANAGYTMLETVTNGLAHTVGALALANSGPNTDGSQFFIMATNWPAWDGNYTVFGHVTAGMDAVTAIAAVPVQGTGSRPVQDVVLSNVFVHRVGSAAAAFDVAAHGVPVVETGPMSASAAGSDLILKMEMASQSKTMFRESADLAKWDGTDFGYQTEATSIWTTSVPRAVLGDTYYFHVSRVRFPEPITSPQDNRGRRFTFWWTNQTPAMKYEANFHSNWWIPGDWTATQGTNAPVGGKLLIFDTWTPYPYAARLFFMDDSGTGKEYSYSLGFNPGQATNRFTGVWWQTTNAALRQPLYGVFTVQ